MTVTFPNMGNVAIAGAALCQALKIPYVKPEPNSKKTLQLGAFYSPEEICLPFKLMMGNFIESIERGADTVLITGSCGPCRFGEYCELQMKILQKMGYEGVEFIVIDFSPEVGMEEFMRRIQKLSKASPLGPAAQLAALYTAFQVVKLCDQVDAKAYQLAGYEGNKGECKSILKEYKAALEHCQSPEETKKLLRAARARLDAVRLDQDRDPVQVAIIGEIFTIIDPFSNLDLEERLMDYGASTTRMLTPSWWVQDLMMKPFKLNSRAIHKAAKPYLSFNVGGHGKECVGEAALAKAHGMDGAIQIFPLGCMPEVVAKAILPAIERDHDLPIMTLIVDEVTGEAGYVTRIEAFLDMLCNRKKQHKVQTLREGDKERNGALEKRMLFRH